MIEPFTSKVVEAWHSFMGPGFINFKGRSGRVEYLTFAILNHLFPMAINFVVVGLTFVIKPPLDLHDMVLLHAALQGIQIFFFASVLSVGVRRLHDLGYSGWWLLLSILIPVFLVAVYMIYSKQIDGEAPIWLLASVIAGVILVLVMSLAMLFAPGQKTDNKYGPALK